MQFWQTKSFAIITHATVPGDCIYRVISQNGDRVLFERLATPRPAPKVTLKSKWHTQQQQQLTLMEGVNRISKEIATWESKEGVRDETKNATEVEITAGTVSKVDVGTHLSEQEVISDAFSNNESEYSRNRTSENWFEQNLHSRRPSCRQDGVQQRIQPCRRRKMGNVELIELKKSSIQCPSCLNYGLEGTLLCRCGKLMRQHQDVMNRIKRSLGNPKGTILPHICDCHKRW